jgi:hypothetical protein
MPSVLMLNVVMPSVLMLNVVMLSLVIPSILMLNVIMLSVVMPSIEYPYAECRYTECRGAVYNTGRRSNLLNGLLDFSHVHSIVPEEADELDRVLGLVLDPQQRVVHVVLTTTDLTPCDASLKRD